MRRRGDSRAAVAPQRDVRRGRPGGGRSLLKNLPLKRFYRDSCCGSVKIPWTAESCLERIGRASLHEPGEEDDFCARSSEPSRTA